MSKPLGEFAHRHVGNSYSPRKGGGLVAETHWEGVATGYGTVFGSLIFDVPDGATSGKVQWIGQAFPEDRPFENAFGRGTWKQVEGAHRWAISFPVVEGSSGDRLRCEGQVDLLTRTFTGQMYEASRRR
jgi:hypothetical protein